MSRSRALGYASGVNLTAADVPKMRVRSTEHEEPRTGLGGFEVRRCAGAAGPSGRVARIRSPRFVAGTTGDRETLRSVVEVKRSASVADRELATIQSSGGLACISRLVRRASERVGLSSPNAKPQVTLNSLPAPLPGGASKSFHLQVVVRPPATGGEGGGPSALYIEALGFASGPALVTLTAIRVAQPPPGETERALLSLLYRRAISHKL